MNDDGACAEAGRFGEVRGVVRGMPGKGARDRVGDTRRFSGGLPTAVLLLLLLRGDAGGIEELEPMRGVAACTGCDSGNEGAIECEAEILRLPRAFDSTVAEKGGGSWTGLRRSGDGPIGIAAGFLKTAELSDRRAALAAAIPGGNGGAFGD